MTTTADSGRSRDEGQVEMRACDLNSKAASKRWLESLFLSLSYTQIPPIILRIKVKAVKNTTKAKVHV